MLRQTAYYKTKMLMSAKYPFAINTKAGKMVTVSEGVRKFKSYCCPNCGGRFIFKNGEVKDAHYAHKRKDCIWRPETELHSRSLRLIANAGRIMQPDGRYFDYDPALSKIEFRKDRMRPDLILFARPGELPSLGETIAAGELIVEVAVTHKVDDPKRAKIIAGGLRVMEIDIYDVDRNIPIEALKSILLEEEFRRKWICEEENVSVTAPARAQMPAERTGVIAENAAEDRSRGFDWLPWAIFAGIALFLMLVIFYPWRKKKKRGFNFYYSRKPDPFYFTPGRHFILIKDEVLL
jgi:hypothetical protein